MSKKIFITIDYELFLGPRTGSVQNCLIIPMNHLMDVLDKYGVKATLFVDCAYLYKLSLLKNKYKQLQDDFDMIISNLKKYISSGHEIQFHFHPQWLYSDYKNNRWNLDFKHYSLENMAPVFLRKTFKESKELVESILNIKMNAFRAGGFTIQNYKNIADLFKDNGIEIDSSVVRNAYINSNNMSYDFRNISTKSTWYFSTEVTLEVANGSFIELPITTSKELVLSSYMKKIWFVLINKANNKCWGDGTSITALNNPWINTFRRIKNILSGSRYIYASLDEGALTNLEKHYRNQHYDNMTWITHPKYLTEYSLKVLDEFLCTHKNRDVFLLVSQCKSY